MGSKINQRFWIIMDWNVRAVYETKIIIYKIGCKTIDQKHKSS